MDDATLITLGAWVAATVRSATPLLLATLGETLTQRVGVINLGVEGEMLVGACAGFAIATITGDPVLGLIGGGIAGLVLSLGHAGLCLGCGANQIGSGLAIWIIGLGATSYFGRSFVGADVSPLPALAGGSIAAIPFLGNVLSQLTWAAPLSILLVFVAGFWLYRTRTGLIWRAVGESVDAARAAGFRPTLVRLQAILLGGFLAGVGGAVLSVDYTQTWAQDMTKGRGLVAVGLVIVARWNPFLTLPVVLLFGLAEASVLRVQAIGIVMSSHLLSSLPYIVAIGLIIFVHLRADRDGGMPADLRSIFGER